MFERIVVMFERYVSYSAAISSSHNLERRADKAKQSQRLSGAVLSLLRGHRAMVLRANKILVFPQVIILSFSPNTNRHVEQHGPRHAPPQTFPTCGGSITWAPTCAAADRCCWSLRRQHGTSSSQQRRIGIGNLRQFQQLHKMSPCAPDFM